MSACGKKTSGPLGLGVSTCVRASWHDGECRPWLTSDERDEAELATLRADFARVTAERDVLRKTCAESIAALSAHGVLRRERDAARAQVRELQKVARAVVAMNPDEMSVRLRVAVAAMPPSMLEEPSDG